MSEEILINVTPPETRVAVVENGVVQEIIIERAERCGLVGNVYRGRICRVLPGMQAAFVDIGLERAAFLHASDIVGKDGEPRSEQIMDLVHEGRGDRRAGGQGPLGTKGARLTTNISIASRYLVFMPTARQHRRVAEDRGRRRAQAPARDPADAMSTSTRRRRLHRPHRRRGRGRRGAVPGHGLPGQALARHQGALRAAPTASA
jgi:Ribonuclease G/E